MFTVESDKIEEIAVKAETGEQTRLQKSGTEWQIVAPAAAAGSSEVSGLTSNLSSLEVQQVVDENPSDLQQHGLTPPRIEVSFKHVADRHEDAAGTDLYAKRGGETKVFTIPSHVDRRSTRSRSTFATRLCTEVDRDKLDAIEFTAGDSTTRFAKPSGEWRMAAQSRDAPISALSRASSVASPDCR